ncbi:MAG: MaoC family dehydratase [Bradyrhizobium sp.]
MRDNDLRGRARASPFKIGQEISREVTFEAGAIRHFATLVGDMNPLHHDEEFAKTSRYGGLIASGTQTSGVMMGAVASFISARAPAVGLGFSVKMKKAIKAGEKAIIVWKVVAIEYKASLGGDIVTFAGELLKADGQVVVSATCANLIFRDNSDGDVC